MGTTWRKQNRFEEAIAAYREAIRLQPDYAEAYYDLGVVLEDLNHIEEAKAAWKQVVVLDNDLEAKQLAQEALKDTSSAYKPL